MDSSLYELDYILNIKKFQKVQDDIAKATDMAIIVVDYRGTPITKHSMCSNFCKSVRNDETLSQLCEKCDSRGGLEATRDHKPYIYLCHVGLVDVAIPIVFSGQYIGALMVGQVKLKNELNTVNLERIVSKKYQIDLNDNQNLKKLYNDLHTMTFEKVKSIADMLYHMINYIVEEAVLKTELNEKNQDLISNNYSEEQITNKKIVTVDKKKMIQPALDYIEKNYMQKLYLDDMASLCNLSSSYFSRMFKLRTGSNFSTYINQVKTQKATDLLITTDLPIYNISLDLGFEDCGYFIKIFKKIHGITPAHYRTEHQNVD